MSFLAKEKLIFDTTAPAEGDNVGAYLRGATGNLISSVTDGGTERLAVATGAEKAEDAAHASGDRGMFALAVRNDADTSMVDTDGDYAPLQVSATGRLKVDAAITNNAERAEDSASASGQVGLSVLNVRQDTLASSVDTDGDYAWFKTNSRGALWTAPVGTVADDAADTENPIKVGSRALGGALAAIASGDRADMISDLYRRVYVNDSYNIAMLATAVNVTNTAVELIPTALGGRRQMVIQNLSNREIFIGPANTVTTANGFRIAAGATIGLDLGPNVTVWAIAANAGPFGVRVLELA